MIPVEICVEDIAGVRAGFAAGAQRVELCSNLEVGGLTPPAAQVLEALQVQQEIAPQGTVMVLVRPRAGDFVYSEAEIMQTCEQIAEILDLYNALRVRNATCNTVSPVPAAAHSPQSKANLGFVVGAVTNSGKLDNAALKRFRAAAGDKPLTFHRAFDTLTDQFTALEELISLGYQRVLTTGGDKTRAQPARLRALVQAAAGKLGIIASGGLRSYNLEQIVREIGVPCDTGKSTGEAAGASTKNSTEKNAAENKEKTPEETAKEKFGLELHMRAPAANGGTDPAEAQAIIAAITRLSL